MNLTDRKSWGNYIPKRSYAILVRGLNSVNGYDSGLADKIISSSLDWSSNGRRYQEKHLIQVDGIQNQ